MEDNNNIRINADSVPTIIRDTMTAKDLKCIEKNDTKKGLRHGLTRLLNLVPWVGGAAAGEIELAFDIRDAHFFRNYIAYLYGLNDTTEKEREEFLNDVEKVAEDYSGNVIAGIISRIDNINKGTLLSNLTRARIEKKISIEEFFRIWNAVERIPFSDLKYLTCFQDDNYIDGGVTEVLYASGTIYQSVVGEDVKFRITLIGEMLLAYGLRQEVTTPFKKSVSVLPKFEVIDEVASFK